MPGLTHVPRLNAVGAVFQLALGQIGEIFSFLYGNCDIVLDNFSRIAWL